jgi:hypothetical protein
VRTVGPLTHPLAHSVVRVRREAGPLVTVCDAMRMRDVTLAGAPAACSGDRLAMA